METKEDMEEVMNTKNVGETQQTEDEWSDWSENEIDMHMKTMEDMCNPDSQININGNSDMRECMAPADVKKTNNGKTSDETGENTAVNNEANSKEQGIEELSENIQDDNTAVNNESNSKKQGKEELSENIRDDNTAINNESNSKKQGKEELSENIRDDNTAVNNESNSKEQGKEELSENIQDDNSANSNEQGREELSEEDIPLIKITTNKRLLMRQKPLKHTQHKRIIISKSVKKAIKKLHQRKKANVTVGEEVKEKGNYNLRRRDMTFHRFRDGVEIDDSDEDKSYKPRKVDYVSSDSDDLSLDIDPPRGKSKTMARDKGWKRRGKTLKSRGRCEPSIVLDPKINTKEMRARHLSGPWVRCDKPKPTKQTAADSQPTTYSQVLKNSRNSALVRKKVLQYHSARLDNLLASNGLERKRIYPDGNCFLNAVLTQISDPQNNLDAPKLRQEIVNHLRENHEHYINFLSFRSDDDEISKRDIYEDTINDIQQDGHWNVELADCMPLAVSNIFKRTIRIYSSRISNQVYDIKPDLCISPRKDNDPITLAFLAMIGNEHYDTVQKLGTTREKSTETFVPETTPTKTSRSAEDDAPTITPRKRAEYKSPVKKELFRKRKRNPDSWLRNKRKFCRDRGMEYVGRTGTRNDERKMKYRDCTKCRFKCSSKISEDLAIEIFNTYWGSGSYEKQRGFICEHIIQSSTKRSSKRKETSNFFHLPCDSNKVRVCKVFFLSVLNLGKKTVELALQKKQHGSFIGSDRRGRQSSANKTPETDKAFIREHISSFPTVSSHYTRKDTQRKYLDSGLSIRKMYQLYQDKCGQLQKRCCSFNIYRQVFCEEFNLSFHIPKKDQCSICTLYDERKVANEVDDDLEETYAQHMTLKERSREEKTKDKQKASADKSFVAATFDLEAVLPTPHSQVGDIYYKRCLSTYNLSIYSLGDKAGTCYLWDETNGGRGSCEIGTCLLLHINSVSEKNQSVKEITYYSDTCGGQNRNQFVSSALIYALQEHQTVQIINHKFFERGHSEMESDSIHSAIEFAKRNTKVYVPSQWDTVVSMARKKNPYLVIPLTYSDFYDLKNLKKDTCKNMKIAVDGTKVNWLKVKWIQVRRECPDSIFLNYTFDKEDFMEIRVRSTWTKGRPSRLPVVPQLKAMYKDRIPISVAKKNDLLSMCQSNIIPRSYHSYYQNLKDSNGKRDKLNEPDVCEDDYDTDE